MDDKTTMTRKEARTQGLKFYNTGEPCVNGHYADRYTSNGGCVECLAEQKAKRDPADIKAYNKKYYADNVDRFAEYNRRFRQNNPNYQREYRLKHT